MKSKNQLLVVTLVVAGLCSLTPKLHAVPMLTPTTATASAVEGGTTIAVTYNHPVDMYFALDPFNYLIEPSDNPVNSVSPITLSRYSVMVANPLNSATDVTLVISGVGGTFTIIGGGPIDVFGGGPIDVFGGGPIVFGQPEIRVPITYRTPESGSTLAMLGLVMAGLARVRRRRA